MRTLFISIAILLLAPVAAADESATDCEAGQAWVGYARTDDLREAYASAGSPGEIHPCEGEHWDGQDPLVERDASCSGEAAVDGTSAFAGLCLGNDPNGAAGDDLVAPAGFRAASDGSAVYVSANVAFVARGALYADGSTLALYARDNTPGNVLVALTQALRVTRPPVGESDCSQAEYEASMAPIGDPAWCDRDNTALTVEHGLLA